jgi:3-deoxy-D-manno-octulosonic-acid transferase
VLQHAAYVGAVSEEDAGRWVTLGVPAERVTVTGDPAVDRVLAYRRNAEIVAALHAWAGDEPILVIGSMEPSDRQAVLALLAAAPRAVVVPHDPEWDPRLPSTATWLPGHATPDARHLVVRQRGVLMDCYAAARAAFVGGGYADRVHALNEPAAVGVPALAGPAAATDLVLRWLAWRDHADRVHHDCTAARNTLMARSGATAALIPLLRTLLA